jgi:hypothetical protein
MALVVGGGRLDEGDVANGFGIIGGHLAEALADRWQAPARGRRPNLRPVPRVDVEPTRVVRAGRGRGNLQQQRSRHRLRQRRRGSDGGRDLLERGGRGSRDRWGFERWCERGGGSGGAAPAGGGRGTASGGAAPAGGTTGSTNPGSVGDPGAEVTLGGRRAAGRGTPALSGDSATTSAKRAPRDTLPRQT